MKIWNLKDYHKLELNSTEEIFNLKTSAKIKVTRVGICASDIVAFSNHDLKKSIVPSRIALGLVSESEDITLKKGQRVMLSPYVVSDSDFATRGVDCDGYLSDYAIVPNANIYTMPDSISDEGVVFVEDVAIAINTFETLNINRTQYVLIYGASTISLIIAQLCIYYQAIPIVIDTDNNRLAISSELEIYYQINPQEEDMATKLKEITSGHMADFAIVDTDTFTLTDGLLDCVGKNGKVGLVGLNKTLGRIKTDVSSVISNNLTIFGINNGVGEIETAINMLATNIIQVDKLVERVVDFLEVPDVFTDMETKQNCFKTIVRC